MTDEVRGHLGDLDGRFISQAHILVVNQDLCEEQQYSHYVETFKHAEIFIDTIKHDQYILRRIYFIGNVKRIDRPTSDLFFIDYDNFEDILDFMANAMWLRH